MYIQDGKYILEKIYFIFLLFETILNLSIYFPKKINKNYAK